MDNPKLINETHLCVIKRQKDSDQLFVDFIELNFPFESSMRELENMSKDDSIDISKMDNFLENSPLTCLTGPFDYCYQLAGTNGSILKYFPVDHNYYLGKLSEFDKEIQTAINPGRITELNHLKDYYIRERKKWIYDHMRIRRKAYIIDQAIEECKKDYTILAFSHRHLGYLNPTSHKLGNDFTVAFHTNFNYGFKSYFRTTICYKGIDILAYSDWVNFIYIDGDSYAIFYTSQYPLLDSSWKNAMDFIAEMYNLSVTDSSEFVESKIMKECRAMVEGLEELINKDINSSHKILFSFLQPNEQILKGIEFLLFKGVKITGALYYISSISKLERISSLAEGFITRIINCNVTEYFQLKKENPSLEKNIKEINIEIDKILPGWTALNKIMEKFKGIKEDIIKEEKEKQPDLGYWESDELANGILIEKYPDYEMKKKEFEPINEKLNALKSDLSKNEGWKKELEGYSKVIESHFESIGQMERLSQEL